MGKYNWLLIAVLNLLVSQHLLANSSDCHKDEMYDKFTQRCVGLKEDKSRNNKKGDGYWSVLYGTGKADVEGRQDSDWRSFEFRFGQWINDKTRVDFIHVNEGHPENNHRDGFASQIVYRHPVTKNIELEVGAGPYFSMNTTRDENYVQLNDKHWGIIVSTAVLYRMHGLLGENAHIRLQYNYVNMEGSFKTNNVMLGMGFELGQQKTRANNNNGIEVAIIGSHYQTHRSSSGSSKGGEVEVKLHRGVMAYSISAIYQGEDKFAHRSGVAARVWYEIPMEKKWSVSAGAGH